MSLADHSQIDKSSKPQHTTVFTRGLSPKSRGLAGFTVQRQASSVRCMCAG